MQQRTRRSPKNWRAPYDALHFGVVLKGTATEAARTARTITPMITARRSAWGTGLVVAVIVVERFQPRAVAQAVTDARGYAEVILIYALYYAEIWVVIGLLLAVVWRQFLAKSWREWRLCRAAAANDTDQVARLLAAGVKPTGYKDVVSGGTPLHWASSAGHAEVVRLLVEAGGQELVRMRLKNGGTCLHLAAEKGHVHVLRELLAALAPAQRKELLVVCSDGGTSCLHLPAHRGDMAVAKLLVNAGGQQLVKLADEEGDTALHLAARSGHVDMSQLLLNFCGNPNLKNDDGRTGARARKLLFPPQRRPSLSCATCALVLVEMSMRAC